MEIAPDGGFRSSDSSVQPPKHHPSSSPVLAWSSLPIKKVNTHPALWKDVTAGHESIGPNLILLETEVKNYVATSGLIWNPVMLGLRPYTLEPISLSPLYCRPQSDIPCAPCRRCNKCRTAFVCKYGGDVWKGYDAELQFQICGGSGVSDGLKGIG